MAILWAGALVVGAAVLAAAAAARPSAKPPAQAAGEKAEAPPPNCSAAVGYGANDTLPGLRVPDEQLGTVCVPFTPVPPAPAGYGGDPHVAAFSDDAARERLAACEAQPPCAAIAYQQGYAPPQFRLTGSLVPFGRIDPHAADVDLRQIRRPGFFASAPYREPVAAAEGRTYTLEYTVPAEPYERINRGITAPVKLRGWYVKGDGIGDARHGRRRALVILVAGRTVETTAVHDPRDPLYARSAETGRFTPLRIRRAGPRSGAPGHGASTSTRFTAPASTC